jgi:hypothetical protein
MSDEVKENKVKQGRPARQLSITDICGIIRYYKTISYTNTRSPEFREEALHDYIKYSNECYISAKSQEEAEEDFAFYEKNPGIYSQIDTSEYQKRAFRNVLKDEKTINDIRNMVSKLDDDTWTKILNRKRQAEYRSKNSKKKISIDSHTFYKLQGIKERKFDNDSWDNVFTKFIKAIETIDNLEIGILDDINNNDDALKLLNSLFD